MTQPKLTAAQQRVFDWLGANKAACIVGDPPGVHLGGYEMRPIVRHKTILAILPHLTKIRFWRKWDDTYETTYIHPKFAGGSDD